MPGPASAVQTGELVEEKFGIGLRRRDLDAASPQSRVVGASQLTSPSGGDRSGQGFIAGKSEYRTSGVIRMLLLPRAGDRHGRGNGSCRQIRQDPLRPVQ